MAVNRYNVITDDEGYVVLIRHTGSPRDFVELDLEDYDFSDDRLTAYKLTNNGLEFDQNKYDEIQNSKLEKENQVKIDQLQDKLDSTDYICVKNVELMIDIAKQYINHELVPGPAYMITDQEAIGFVKSVMSYFKEAYDEYGSEIYERESARDSINNLRETE